MGEIKVNDYVKRKSYGGDIKFRVIDIVKDPDNAQYMLKGMKIRLMADSVRDDLELLQPEEILEERHNSILLTRQVLKRIEQDRNRRSNFLRNDAVTQNYYQIPGKVLHIDGDKEYLEKCINAYKMLDVPAIGVHIQEKELPEKVVDVIKTYCPNILVLTGHDALKKDTQDYKSMSSYKTSRYFVDAIRSVRLFEPNRDSLVVIAGACQSYYEALIDAGANFATSPKRISVHAFDPVYIAEKIAFTSIYQKINLEEALGNTITGKDGIGGVDTRGHYRVGFPKSNY